MLRIYSWLAFMAIVHKKLVCGASWPTLCCDFFFAHTYRHLTLFRINCHSVSNCSYFSLVRSVAIDCDHYWFCSCRARSCGHTITFAIIPEKESNDRIPKIIDWLSGKIKSHRLLALTMFLLIGGRDHFGRLSCAIVVSGIFLGIWHLS